MDRCLKGRISKMLKSGRFNTEAARIPNDFMSVAMFKIHWGCYFMAGTEP